MSGGKPYSDLGKVMDALARKRDVRGPYNVGKFVREKTGTGPRSGSAWSQIFYGESHPQPKTMRAFTEAFELTDEEVGALARAYMFRGLAPKLAA